MNQIAKKGDMALVIGYQQVPVLLGRIVSVMSDPAILTGCLPDGTTHTGLSNEVEPPADCAGVYPSSNVWHVATRNLIPIRDPDADVSRTTDREVMA